MPFCSVYIRSTSQASTSQASTSQASTSQGSLRNECTHNCSAPNTKIRSGGLERVPQKITETIADP
jgi:hypothetical protein